MSDNTPDSGPLGKISHWIKSIRKPRNSGDTLREALEDFIEEIEEAEEENSAIAAHERSLLSNILKLRDLTVHDVMVPRADITAIERNASQEDILKLLQNKQFSRVLVYRETLDDIIGALHIKDMLAALAAQQPIQIVSLLREIPIVSPAMPVLDLLLLMRETKKHLAMVVDEFGGTDGLVGMNDVIVAIVGEVNDEFNTEITPELEQTADGTLYADARLEIDLLEEKFGNFLNDDEREEIETLGGLVFSIAGRVPARGEVLRHEESGLVFEIIDADPRKVNRVRIKKAA